MASLGTLTSGTSLPGISATTLADVHSAQPPLPGAHPIGAVVAQIVGEYHQKIADLMQITADLPRRLECCWDLERSFGEPGACDKPLNTNVRTPKTRQHDRPNLLAAHAVANLDGDLTQEVVDRTLEHHRHSSRSTIGTGQEPIAAGQGPPLEVVVDAHWESEYSIASVAVSSASAPAMVPTIWEHREESSVQRNQEPWQKPFMAVLGAAGDVWDDAVWDSTASPGHVASPSCSIDSRSPSRSRILAQRQLENRSARSATKYVLKEDWCPQDGDKIADRRLSTARRALRSRSPSHPELRRGISRGESSFNLDASWSSDQVNDYKWAQWIVSNPTSATRMGWELCGILLVMYDLITIPFIMAFDPPRNAFTDICGWIVLIFWTLNFPVALTTGFFANGVLVLNLRRIVQHYLRTWCVVDILTVVPDWILTFSSMPGDSGKGRSAGSVMKFLRILRLLRLARMVRMLKIGNAWNMIYDLIDSEQQGIVFQVISVVMFLMLFTHFNACVWFAIGSLQKGTSWLTAHKFTEKDVDLLHQYLVSYHWAITLFTPASMDVQPHNVYERAFTITVVVFGMVGFSYLVGRITGSLNRLSVMKEQKSKNFRVLRQYLKVNHVQRDLSIRIRSYLENRWEHRHKNIKTSEVELLNLLSEHLRAELACAIHGPSLLIHPLFDHLKRESSLTIRRVTLKCVSVSSWAPQDEIFVAGEGATHMLVVTSGLVEYRRMHYGEGIFEESTPVETLTANEGWLAEQVLWVRDWHHLGDLRSITATDALRVSGERFATIAKINPLSLQMVSRYAREFVKWLNSLDSANLTEVAKEAFVADDLRGLVAKVHSSTSKPSGGSRRRPSSQISLFKRFFT